MAKLANSRSRHIKCETEKHAHTRIEIVPAPTTRRQDTTWWSHGLMVKSHLNSINLSITYHVPLKAIIHWPPLSHSRGLVVSWSQFKFLFYNPSHPFSWSRGLMVSWLIKIFKNSTPSCLFSWSHGLVVSWSHGLNSNFHFITPLINSRSLVVSWSHGLMVNLDS